MTASKFDANAASGDIEDGVRSAEFKNLIKGGSSAPNNSDSERGSESDQGEFDDFLHFINDPQGSPPPAMAPAPAPSSPRRPPPSSFKEVAPGLISFEEAPEVMSFKDARPSVSFKAQETFSYEEESGTTKDVEEGGSSCDSSKLSLDRVDALKDGDAKEEEDSGHGHAGPTNASLVASSVVCFIIYFVFCIVFASVTWDPIDASRDENIDPPFGIPQGVGINLMGIAVGSIFFAWKSGSKCIIAGPDLLPVVFFAEAGSSVYAYLVSLSDPCAAAAAGGAHRALGAAAGVATEALCGGDAGGSANAFHRFLAGGGAGAIHEPELIAQVVPTTLVAMMIGNIVTGLVFYGLGKMKNTASVIGFIPASVVAGFLTCIGYKVIKLAVLITTGFAFKEKYIREIGIDLPHANDPWVPLLIALVYGLVLYGLKRMHVVAAEKLILGFIFVPIAMFFIIAASAGVPMDELRETDWFLTQTRDGQGCTSSCAFTRVNFWQTLQVAYGGIFSGNLVAWGAIPRCIPIFIMGAVMTSLDSMLKLTSSEKALNVDLEYNHEMQLGGKATIFSTLLCGTPAYGQTKFNVINLSIARTADSPLPTLYLGGICLLVFVSGVAGLIINIMPRFLLGGLCVFAGVGFLYENLWEGRKNMNRVSFAIVWIIFLVNFIWEFFVLQNIPKEIQPMVPGLLVVFILGIVLSTFEFMFAFMHKAKLPEIKSGDKICSSAIRSEKHDNQLAVMSPWFQVFSVESFVFFGTANALYQQLKTHLANQKATKPKAERTKYLIFDLAEVTGIDSSAKNVFFKVHRLLKAEGIKLVWAMNHPKLVKKFTAWGLYAGTKQFHSLDFALRYVEDKLLSRAAHLSDKWLVKDTVRRIFERQVLANVFNISVRSDEKGFSSARLRPWSERLSIAEGEELCGPDDDNLYMLYDGEVQIRGRDDVLYPVFTGSFFNLDQLLISIGALPGLPSTHGAVATKDSMVLAVSRKKFVTMQKEDGALAQKLLMTLIVQNESNRPGKCRVQSIRNKATDEVDKSDRDDVHGMKSMSTRLLKGNDYKISLTEAQAERFSDIFNLILKDCEPGADEIPMDQFSAYVSMEARALGSQLEHKQFMAMIDASGIDEDGDGALSIDEFLSFLRGLFLSDIPSSQVPALREAYEAAVAKSPDEPMDESRVQVLFESLGFDVDSTGWQDVMGVIDADGDGDVDFSEFLTGVGMMKQFCVFSNQLDDAFRSYKSQAAGRMARGSFVRAASMHRQSQSLGSPQDEELGNKNQVRISRISGILSSGLATFGISQRKMNIPVSEHSDQSSQNGALELNAADLEAFLSVPRDYAEEMVFLADQDEVEVTVAQGEETDEEVTADRTIDREEFQQLLRSWS